MKYKIDIEYLVPEFSTVELEAETEAEARAQAIVMIAQENPEAIEIEVISINGY